ncbi:hypothetical protein [Fretibacter rubidus]|uniref:hypothetical protein n=1 Tax=Fretibacter rubidus TaxID=570162 RepID=UPI00352A45C7
MTYLGYAILNALLLSGVGILIAFRRSPSFGLVIVPIITSQVGYWGTWFLFVKVEKAWTFSDDPSPIIVSAMATALMCLFTGYVFNRIRANIDKGPPYFRFFNTKLIPLDQRVTLIFVVWMAMALITAVFWSIYEAYPNAMAEAFIWSWTANGAFFTIVGFVISLTGLKLPHQEDFDTRLSILFGGDTSEAMKATRDKVRALGFYVYKLERRIKVEEWSDQFQAYRVSVENVFTLRNLFGDVAAEDEMGVFFNPDKFDVPPTPIGMYKSIRVASDPHGRSRMKEPVEIPPEGLEISEEFSVGSDDELVTTQYWSWIKIDEIWSHEPRRFTECAEFEVESLVDESTGSVVVEFFDDGTMTKPRTETLSYGDLRSHGGLRNLQSSQKHVTLRFKAPSCGVTGDEVK